ncbi:hypothetical protein [Streptomyces sp. NPDC008121]|uniref:hypothetical protein n=1 Tax=Streptomyces sp. NPDC008121 TaxID=3364809 RepID=UPI0036F0DA8B
MGKKLKAEAAANLEAASGKIRDYVTRHNADVNSFYAARYSDLVNMDAIADALRNGDLNRGSGIWHSSDAAAETVAMMKGDLSMLRNGMYTSHDQWRWNYSLWQNHPTMPVSLSSEYENAWQGAASAGVKDLPERRAQFVLSGYHKAAYDLSTEVTARVDAWFNNAGPNFRKFDDLLKPN